MKHVLVLMKAMPPTTGHKDLIEFASGLGSLVLVMDYKKDEPMVWEREDALRRMVDGKGILYTYNVEEQDPEAPGFWEQWDDILKFAKSTCDYVVASEPYGAEVARRIGARFIPYDIERSLNKTKATNIRENPVPFWSGLAPEFKKHLKTRITVFGAESNGKTTFSKDVAWNMPGDVIFEWARPYLETVGPEITVDSMTDIWYGQRSLQRLWWERNSNKQILYQDTDLFSTVGYWEQPHWREALGPVPSRLIDDAIRYKSDLYIILKSNIAFEQDPIRYGGDKRESPDEYWIALADKYDLNYVVIEASDRIERIEEATPHIKKAKADTLSRIAYDRKGF